MSKNTEENAVRQLQENNKSQKSEQSTEREEDQQAAEEPAKKHKNSNKKLEKGDETREDLPKRQKNNLQTQADEEENEENSILEEFKAGEDRQVGAITWSTFNIYAKSLGGYKVIISIALSSFLSHACTMFANKYLEDWSNNFKTSDKLSQLRTYAIIWFGVAATQLLGQFIKIYCINRMSTIIHSKMMYNLLHSKLQRFLDRIPYGQIQNRFSQDVQNVDRKAVIYLHSFLDPLTECFVIFGTMAYIVGWQIFLFVFIWFIVVYKLERWYMNGKRESRRLKAMSSSPVITTSSDVIKGLVNIRAMNLRQFFREQFLTIVS